MAMEGDSIVPIYFQTSSCGCFPDNKRSVLGGVLSVVCISWNNNVGALTKVTAKDGVHFWSMIFSVWTPHISTEMT